MNHVMIMDNQGRCVIVQEKMFLRTHWKTCTAAKVVETGDILKGLPLQFKWPSEAPPGTPLYVHTKWGYKVFGPRAVSWHIGFEGPNGFCIPSKLALDTLYVRAGQ